MWERQQQTQIKFMIKVIKDKIPERCVVIRFVLLSFTESPD